MVMKMSGLVYTCQYFSFAKVMINNFFFLIISLTELHVSSNSVSNHTAVLVIKQIGLPLHSCLISVLNTCTCMIVDRIDLFTDTAAILN